LGVGKPQTLVQLAPNAPSIAAIETLAWHRPEPPSAQRDHPQPLPVMVMVAVH